MTIVLIVIGIVCIVLACQSLYWLGVTRKTLAANKSLHKESSKLLDELHAQGDKCRNLASQMENTTDYAEAVFLRAQYERANQEFYRICEQLDTIHAQIDAGHKKFDEQMENIWLKKIGAG